jgi:CelD/BcsL family acetyltransferase involved in cellulose biosynthesis
MHAPLGRLSADVAGRADPRHAFLRAAWFADAGRTLEARRGGTVIAALPIVRRRGVAAVAGCYWPYRSFPLAADASDEELAAFLRGRDARRALGPAWRIGPVREDDPTAVQVGRIAAESGWTILRRPLGTSFLLDVAGPRREGGWPRNSTLRKNRWFEKQLAADGPLDFEFFTGSEWTPALFDTLAEVERNSWIASRTDARDAKFLAPHHRRFWEKAAADPVLAGMMRAAVLRVGGRPAAFLFSILSGRTLYAIANSYDAAFARHSPGRVLAYRELALLMDDIDEVDWGAGDPGYKTTMGAVPGPAILDLLLVRPRPLAALLRPLWERRWGG